MRVGRSGGPVSLVILCWILIPSVCTAQITRTANFETGLQRLATVDMNIVYGAKVEWGDGTSNQGLLNCNYGILHPNECDILGTHTYAKKGVYSISISYDGPLAVCPPGVCGYKNSLGTTATISPPGDFVILTIGDSVASGEGNPDVSFSPVDSVNEAYWDDPLSDYSSPQQPCHRSSKAGFVEAQQEAQSNNPAITTINYACSGDNVQQAIDALRAARQALPRIDVLLISVGANNVDGGFSKIVEGCLLNNPTTPCSEDSSFVQNTSNSINNLSSCTDVHSPSCYPNLAKEINCIDPDTGTQEPSCTDPPKQIPKLVLMTEYFDPTHNQNGEFPTLAGDPICIAGVTALTVDEWKYLYNSVVVPLNQQVDSFPSLASAAGLAAPTYAVTGIQNDFLDHGYCAGDPIGERWVNNFADAGIEGDAEGVSHPNAPGQADYESRIYNALVTYNPPATTASATAGGAPYAFGTWTTHNVTVALKATNAIGGSGVGDTFYGVDNTACSSDDRAGCQTYGGPFAITTSGKHTVTFFSKNAKGYPEQVESVQVWVDNAPPVMTCTASPSVLWPPNNKMVPVKLNVTAVSAAFGPTPFTLSSISTSQGNIGSEFQGFVDGQSSTEGSLLASRLGNDKVRQVYTFVYQSTDQLGLTGTCTVNVQVPHDQRR